MPTLNTFLYPVPQIVNGNHRRACFCSIQCRAAAVHSVISDLSSEDIYNEYYRIIPNQEEFHLNNLVKKTNKKILFGYSFCMVCLSGTRVIHPLEPGWHKQICIGTDHRRGKIIYVQKYGGQHLSFYMFYSIHFHVSTAIHFNSIQKDVRFY